MKKIFLTILILLGLTSCYDAGTIKTGTENQKYKSLILNDDTIDFFQFYPSDGQSVWVGIPLDKKNIYLGYKSGKTDENVILINKKYKNKTRIIEGSVISENVSVLVIKKNK